MQQQSNITDAIQVALPTASAGALILGLSLQDWVWALTIFLLLLQIPYFAWTKYVKPWRTAKQLARKRSARLKRRKVVTAVVAKRDSDAAAP